MKCSREGYTLPDPPGWRVVSREGYTLPDPPGWRVVSREGVALPDPPGWRVVSWEAALPDSPGREGLPSLQAGAWGNPVSPYVHISSLPWDRAT